jgi:hypothetical protein
MTEIEYLAIDRDSLGFNYDTVVGVSAAETMRGDLTDPLDPDAGEPFRWEGDRDTEGEAPFESAIRALRLAQDAATLLFLVRDLMRRIEQTPGAAIPPGMAFQAMDLLDKHLGDSDG